MSFDSNLTDTIQQAIGLNPFGTGQCLSTYIMARNVKFGKSQSLWNRAMSFDK